MASFFHFSSSILGFTVLVLLVLQFQFSYSLTCSSQKLAKNRLYKNCNDLPYLNAYLHWTFDTSKSTLDVAFIAPPPTPEGWVAWAINPTSVGMVGAQTLIAFVGENGKINLNTSNVMSYEGIELSKINLEVPEKNAEFVDGFMRIYATMIIPKELGTVVNQVWQVGSKVKDGIPSAHAMGAENMNSKGTLDLVKGQTNINVGGGDSKYGRKNIHGLLNAVSWGILFPVGVVIARYLRTFESADPAWFYLHVSCQVSAYIIGVAGWGTGMKLGNESKGIEYTHHRNIGIALFCLATLQVFALFLRPRKDHKYRIFWNFYHHGVGYLIVVLGIINVFKGLSILSPAWRVSYITLLFVLFGISILLEVITWIVVLKRKSRKSADPFSEQYSS